MSCRLRGVTRQELEALTRFIYESGQLKHSKRQGWWQAGIKDPETVAEHSFRVAVIGYVLALMEGADPAITAATCLFHDIIETRLGDIPNVTKHYTSPEAPEIVAADQVAGMPSALADGIKGLVHSYSEQASKEAILARDADKLECLMQAREYQTQGYQNVEPWITSNLAKLKSESARALAVVGQELPPDQWWKTFAQAYANNVGANP
jgi:5'-deoxynucleotidase YfbR-like HD superfamily hydrolase